MIPKTITEGVTPYFTITKNEEGKYAVIRGQDISQSSFDHALQNADEKPVMRVSIVGGNLFCYFPTDFVEGYVRNANMMLDGTLRGQVQAACEMGDLELITQNLVNLGAPIQIEKPARIRPPPGRGV